MNKKGQEIQFNWILIIIAGAIILAFFSIFIIKYIDLQEKKEAVEIGRTLDESLRLLESTQTLYLPIELGLTTQLEYFCIDETAFIKINNNYDQNIKDKVVYLPTNLKDNSLISWVYSFKQPFFITNIIYLSSSSKKYYFYNAPEEIYNQIPNIFNKEKVNLLSNLPDNKDVKIISFGVLPTTFEDAEVLVVDTENKKLNFNGQEAYYYGDGLLFGAIFSDYEHYKCIENKLLKKIHVVSDVYSRKASYLSATNPSCDYTKLKTALDKLKVINKIGEYEETEKFLTEENMKIYGGGCLAVF